MRVQNIQMGSVLRSSFKHMAWGLSLVCGIVVAQTTQPEPKAAAAPSESNLNPGSTIYRCIDLNSKIWLLDAPMKDAACKKIEVPVEQNVVAPPDTLKQRSAAADQRLKTRAGNRDRLREQFEAAEKKLADARAALEAGLNMKDDERIATESRPDPGTKPDKQGRQSGRGGLVTCTTVRTADGALRTLCPAILVPNEAYYQRVGKLEKAVSDAEVELDKAREEFRRGAD